MTKHSKIWRLAKPDKALQEILSEQLDISKVVAQILINRGITTFEEASAFLNADIKSLHNPFLCKDMDKAVHRILAAIDNNEKILIYGDYDVDGITSTTLLLKYLRHLGAQVEYYIPDRSDEGYGLNIPALQRAIEAGFNLVITVDCGISAVEEVDYANRLGLDIIVTDHHEVPDILPAALAVIDPKQSDCQYPFKDLAGVGVAWKLGQALMLEKGLPAHEGEKMLDIVTLGTIADIVPLVGENRVLVKMGLQTLSQTANIGIQALLTAAGLNDKEISAYHIGYTLAPRLNAVGRIGNARVGVQLLLTDSASEAMEIALSLNKENEKRQAIEAKILEEAQLLVESNYDQERGRVIVLASENWHPGVVGIVASRLVEKFHRPTILICLQDGIGKGSARSIPGFDLYDALNYCGDYLVKFGGHKQAAGLTIEAEKIPVFYEAIDNYARTNLAEEYLVPQVTLDAEVDLHQVNQDLISEIELLSPFGHHNPSPVFVCRQASVMEFREVGKDSNHLKMKVSGYNSTVDTIGFQLGEWAGKLNKKDHIDLAFVPEINVWQGRTSIQLKLKDIKYPELSDNPYEPAVVKEKTFIDRLFDGAAQFLVDDYYKNIGLKGEFYTKVAGVTFENRQSIIALLQEGDQVKLNREPSNKFDPNAIKVETITGEQVGYLNAEMAKYLAPLLDSGQRYKSLVTNVTGGDDRNFGLNIIVQKILDMDPDELKAQLARQRQRLNGLDEQALIEEIRATLLGSNSFREKQWVAISELLNGINTLAIFGTGRGKSAVFQTVAAIKAIRSNKMTVIIYPLRALVNDQYETMAQKLQPLGLNVFRANGSLSTLERAQLFNALDTGTADILLTTPEFIEFHMERFKKNIGRIGLFVVDESHHISLASNSHRPAYKRLGKIQTALDYPLTLAVTATADDEVADEIIATLQIKQIIIDPHIRANLNIVDKRDCADKNEYIKKIVANGEKTVVYVNSRAKTIEIAAYLRQALPQLSEQIIFYNAGMSSEQRNQVERMFRAGDVQVVVSTSAFGEGIDIPDIKHVILYHLNFNFTEFNQQSGRSGRNGEKAMIHLIFGQRDVSINRFILENSIPGREMLIKQYLLLKQLAQKQNPINMTNTQIADLLNKDGAKEANERSVSAGLGIFDELNLITREREGRTRYIHFISPTGDKMELTESLRFTEGLVEKRAFDEFQQFLFGATSETLLELVNQPIYPKKYLTAKEII